MVGEVLTAGYQDLPVLEQARGLVDAGVFMDPVAAQVLAAGLYSRAEMLLCPLLVVPWSPPVTRTSPSLSSVAVLWSRQSCAGMQPSGSDPPMAGDHWPVAGL